MKFDILTEHKHASGVYIIRNSVNGKVYVGSAANFWKRYQKHANNLKNQNHHCAPLQRFAAKYGADKLRFEVLELTQLEKQALIECEQKWIDCLRCCDRESGFNLAPVAGSTLGVKHSEESRAARVGKRLSEETKRRLSEAHKGKSQKPFTEEQRERQRAAVSAAAKLKKGRPATPRTTEQREQQRAAVVAANTGRKMPPESVRKSAEARRGKKRSPEVGAKISAAFAAKREENPLFMRGKKPPRTAEHSRKIIEARRANAFARQSAV